jgi:hypothetical protein
MNQLQLFEIALRVVPTYDGKVNSLYRFISAIDSIVEQYYDVANPDNFQNVIVTNGIISKLIGKASEVIDINAARNWNEIKTALIENFADQRDENSLNRDLINLTQGNETPQQFYDRCIHLLNTLINYVNIHNADQNVRDCKRDFFTMQTLKTFLAGLKGPLGPTIRAMRPSTLPEALQFIKEESNIVYLQKRTQGQSSSFDQNKFGPRQNQNASANVYRLPVSDWNRSRQQFNNPTFSQNQPQFNHNRGNATQNRPNAFYQDPRTYRAPRPTPMSGISHGSAMNNFPRPTNNNIPNTRPRFVPFQSNEHRQPNMNRPNAFQNIGYYPEYRFEELNQHEMVSEPEQNYPEYRFEEPNQHAMMSELEQNDNTVKQETPVEDENANFHLVQDFDSET